MKKSSRAVPEREARRSFVLGLINGVLVRTGLALIDPLVVLTWFVSRLTTSNLVIGLVSPLWDACWFLPQVFVSARVQRMERKMPVYAAVAVIRTIGWALLAATVWLIDDPTILLASFFALLIVTRLANGLAGLAFFDVVAKTVPARRRGRFLTLRWFLGSALALASGLVVNRALSHPQLPFPHGHALLFTLYPLVMIPALVSFTLIREPPGAAVNRSVTVGEQLRRAGRLLRENRIYRRYVSARLSLALANIALPFFGVYAIRVLGASEGMAGTYVAAGIGAMLLFNLPWGWFSDRRGNQQVMRLLAVGKGLTALLALALGGLVSLLELEGGYLPYLALPLFFLSGAVKPAAMLTGSNFLLELAPEEERPLYLGFSNTLMGIVAAISGMGGLVVDLLGYAGLFSLSLALCLAAYLLTRGLPEPREGA